MKHLRNYNVLGLFHIRDERPQIAEKMALILLLDYMFIKFTFLTTMKSKKINSLSSDKLHYDINKMNCSSRKFDMLMISYEY